MENKVELRTKIFRGIKAAIEKLISTRASEKGFIIISKNGKIVKIAANELKKS
jgi:hypothetical protein